MTTPSITLVSTGPGWCPFAVRRETAKVYRPKAKPFRLSAITDHVCDGPYLGSWRWLQTSSPSSSAHFVIDDISGEITQLASIFDRTWANGLRWDSRNRKWFDPEGLEIQPTAPWIVPGLDPNYVTISIEHAGYSGKPWSPALYASSVRLHRWIADQTGLKLQALQTVSGHFQISPKSRARCPGPTWPVGALVRDALSFPAFRATVQCTTPSLIVRAGASKFTTDLGARIRQAEEVEIVAIALGIPVNNSPWGMLQSGGWISLAYCTPPEVI